MTPLEILKSARALIAKPENWTQNAYATNGKMLVTVRSPDATCFCALGAVLRVVGGFDSDDIPYEVAFALHPALGNNGVATFNDTHTHPEVLEMFDRAIEKLENQ